ncbi:MAG: XdhC family protein [Bacteroidota bacterium]
MFSDFLQQSNQLYQEQEPFALAMVVRRTIPSSGKPGDKAIIKKSGEIIGWIGGGCTRGIILKEALISMQDGKPRMVRISPKAELEAQSGVIDYKMTCQSGGAVEVYIEPILPKPHIVIMGNNSHVAMALHRIAKAMDYAVTVVGREVDIVAYKGADRVIAPKDFPEQQFGPHTFVVISTQGEGDERALQQALATDIPYVAFVASRRKANAIFRSLMDLGIPSSRLQQVKTPAGLDINAKLPEEVAVSILAQIISEMRGEARQLFELTPVESALSGELAADLYINPVCNIPVQKSTAKHVIEYKGESYYFCCDNCKVSFEQAPEKYAVTS